MARIKHLGCAICAALGLCCVMLLWACNTQPSPPPPPSVDERVDMWVTDTATTSKQTFANQPIPAGFFDFDGRSCESFGGEADFVGAALNTSTAGAADTVIWRSADPIEGSDPVGTEKTVAVRITNLNLWTAEPITVTCGGEPTQWRVQATLSDTSSPQGTMTAKKTHDNGGTAETLLPVLLKLTFTNVAQPSTKKTLDFAAVGWDAVEFEADMAWVHKVDPSAADSKAGFMLGVAGGPVAAKLIAQGKAGPRLQGGNTLIACTEHVNPGGSHQHNTCAADTDNDGVPDGADNCRFAANPDQEDGDEDTFGDACDPCPDDPDCPDVDCEDGGVCAALNEEILTTSGPLVDITCELATSCDFFFRFFGAEPSEHCQELMGEYFQLTQNVQDMMCQQTRFMAHGCDRCVGLEQVQPPSCLEDIFGGQGLSSPDPCSILTCAEGYACDSDSGQCCDSAGECVPGTFDPCASVSCPEGQECDPNTGGCCETGSMCEPWVYDPCAFQNCPAGQECRPDTGLCCDIGGECDISFPIPCDPEDPGTCEVGFVCQEATRTCWNPTTDECGSSSFPTQ